jgi:hypothetical protein
MVGCGRGIPGRGYDGTRILSKLERTDSDRRGPTTQSSRLFRIVKSSTWAADAEFERSTRGREHNMSVQLDLVRLGGWIGGSHCRRQLLLGQAVRSGVQIGGRAGQSQDRRPSSPGEVLPIQYPAANQF